MAEMDIPLSTDKTTPKYEYNPELTLVEQFYYLRDNIRPEKYEDKYISKAIEELYDAVVPVMNGYRDTLDVNGPLATYLDYFLRNPVEIMEDEEDEPELYATVPLGTDAIQTKVGVITPLSTVRITAASPLGDVGITTNLSAPRGSETRVFWDSLIKYRTTPVWQKEEENKNV